MWNRKALKRQGKAAFRRNYWRCVLVGLLLIAIVGSVSVTERLTAKDADNGSYVYKDYEDLIPEETDPSGWTFKDQFEDGAEADMDQLPFFTEPSGHEQSEEDWEDISPAALIASVVGGLLAAVLILALAILVNIYIANPLEVGCRRFFLMNLRQEPGEVKEVAYAFDHGWKNSGRILFSRNLKLILYYLLLIVPGIIKTYEYRMIPYLLAEDPTMDKADAFAMSKYMMRGRKWKAFLLDLSFIGWSLLTLVTLGVVGIFYAIPYQLSTDAALYAHIRYGELQTGYDRKEIVEEPLDIPGIGEAYGDISQDVDDEDI